MTRFIAACICALFCLAFTTGAEARQRHKTYAAHPDCNVLWPCEGVTTSARGERIVKAMGGFGSAQKVYTPRAAVEKRALQQNPMSHAKTQQVASNGWAEEITLPANNRKHLWAKTASKEINRLHGIPAPSFDYSIGRPARYIAGRLICAINVNAALAERGIRGTGSALALSFRHWGRSAGGPVPGAVIVSERRGGGHVAIVSRVENGVVYAWNATGGQRGWREIPYRHPVIDYRVPG
jgi:hypothetical protein